MSGTGTSLISQGRIRGLDGLRGLAMIAVFSFHSNALHLHGGWLGIDIFFCLSGFLITTLLIRERRTRGRLGLAAFYGRRARRLVPAVVVLLGGLLLLFAIRPSPWEPDTRAFMPYVIGYVGNWALIAQDPYVDLAFTHSLLSHTWSLAVEEEYYLLWPLCFLALLRFVGKLRTAAYLVGAVAILDGIYPIIAWHHGLFGLKAHSQLLHDRLFWGSDTHAAGLLLGCATALYTASRTVTARALLALRCAALVGAVYLVYIAFHRWPNDYVDGGGELAIELAGTTVVWCIALGPTKLVLALLELPPLAYLGKISYGFYLWSIPVILEVDTLPHEWSSLNERRAVQFLITLVLGMLTYHLVERLIRRMKVGRRRATRSQPASSPAASVPADLVT